MSDAAMQNGAAPGALRRGWRRLNAATYGSGFYRLWLDRAAPAEPTGIIVDPWPGDPASGDALFQGRYRFHGREAVLANQPPWRLRPDDLAWTRSLHGFRWLRHFRASGGEAARQHARRLVRSWIDLCGEWHEVSWTADVLASRIVAWLGQADWLFPDGRDDDFAAVFKTSLGRQVRHLGQVAGDGPSGLARLRIAAALVLTAHALDDRRARLERDLKALADEVAWQILPDGGHVGRSPMAAFLALHDLVLVARSLAAAERPVPDWLARAIARIGGFLRLMRHADGGLGVFNGGNEGEPAALDIALAEAGVAAAPAVAAADSGYQRLATRRAIVLFDCGLPPPGPIGAEAHAGALAFEFSVAKHRLVVNCGGAARRGPEWAGATRQTAAHSTLVLADHASNRIGEDGQFHDLPPPPRSRRHEDEDGNAWIEAASEGYRARDGYEHRRRLYLSASGGDFRGEDTLAPEGAVARAGLPFTIRFHLHPEVQVSRLQGGSSCLLKLPDGQGWRFLSDGAGLSLEDSVYLGHGAQARRSQQIVLSGQSATEPAVVKWAFRRI